MDACVVVHPWQLMQVARWVHVYMGTTSVRFSNFWGCNSNVSTFFINSNQPLSLFAFVIHQLLHKNDQDIVQE